MKKKLLELISNRQTVRKYKINVFPDDHQISEILECARKSQSAHNFQPWRFVIIKDRNTIKDIADILMLESKKMHIGFNILMKDASATIRNAPVLIAVFNTGAITNRFGKFGRKYRGICEAYECQSIAASIQNMCLAASVIGLGTAWIGIAVFCEKSINKLLKVKLGLEALIAVGIPDEKPIPVSRKSMEEMMITFKCVRGEK